MATLTPLVGPTCQSPLSLHLLSLHSPRPAAAGHLAPLAAPPHPVAGPRHRHWIRARARRRRWIRSRPSSGRPDPCARASSSTAAGELLRHRRGCARSSSTATAMAARGSRRSRGCASPTEQGMRRARPTRGCVAPAEEGGGRRPAGLSRAAPWRYRRRFHGGRLRGCAILGSLRHGHRRARVSACAT